MAQQTVGTVRYSTEQLTYIIVNLLYPYCTEAVVQDYFEVAVSLFLILFLIIHPGLHELLLEALLLLLLCSRA
jgi:hypothetical protein